MLAIKIGQFPVEAVLVEEKIDIDREFFLSFAIDDAARSPMIIFSAGGGSGIEERAAATRRIPCDVNRGPFDSAVDEAVASCELSAKNAKPLTESIRKLFAAARSVEARSLEINPLVLTKTGEFVAADCRITIDDYAVGRHPALRSRLHVSSIIPDGSRARRLRRRTKRSSRHILFRTVGNSGTKRIQGTRRISRRRRRRLDDVDGCHRECRVHDRKLHRYERNPSASKVYRAARIILAQPDLVGYFGSGSGVAARNNTRPRTLSESVLGTRSRHPRSDSSRRQHRRSRCGDLHRISKLLRAPVEGYRKTTRPLHRRAFCRTGRQLRRQKMETSHTASAKICERSLHHTSQKLKYTTKTNRKKCRVWIDIAHGRRSAPQLKRIQRINHRSRRAPVAHCPMKSSLPKFRAARLRRRMPSRCSKAST